MVVLFCGGLLLSPVYVNAQEDDGGRILRKGTCWLDGTPNCRKKKNGSECDQRKHCSAKAYITAIGGVLGAIAAADRLVE